MINYSKNNYLNRNNKYYINNSRMNKNNNINTITINTSNIHTRNIITGSINRNTIFNNDINKNDLMLIQQNNKLSTNNDIISLFNQADSNNFTNIINTLSTTSSFLNIKNVKNGYTFLFYAIKNKDLKATVQLLKLGCNPNISDNYNINCFQQAFFNILDYEVNTSCNIIKDLHLLLILTLRNDFNIKIKDDIPIVFEKIQKIINKKDNYGNTLMHYIIISEKFEKNINICNMILKYIKTDLNNINNEGDSILHSLVHNIKKDFNNIEYFYLLQDMIKYGANENVYDSKKKLPNDYLKECFN